MTTINCTACQTAVSADATLLSRTGHVVCETCFHEEQMDVQVVESMTNHNQRAVVFAVIGLMLAVIRFWLVVS